MNRRLVWQVIIAFVMFVLPASALASGPMPGGPANATSAMTRAPRGTVTGLWREQRQWTRQTADGPRTTTLQRTGFSISPDRVVVRWKKTIEGPGYKERSKGTMYSGPSVQAGWGSNHVATNKEEGDTVRHNGSKESYAIWAKRQTPEPAAQAQNEAATPAAAAPAPKKQPWWKFGFFRKHTQTSVTTATGETESDKRTTQVGIVSDKDRGVLAVSVTSNAKRVESPDHLTTKVEKTIEVHRPRADEEQLQGYAQ